jgi:hypothetical protein
LLLGNPLQTADRLFEMYGEQIKKKIKESVKFFSVLLIHNRTSVLKLLNV